MLQTIKGKYREGRVELAEIPDQVAEAEVLVTFLPRAEEMNGAAMAETSPATLYGVWRDSIPSDFDVEAALQDIRSQSR